MKIHSIVSRHLGVCIAVSISKKTSKNEITILRKNIDSIAHLLYFHSQKYNITKK